MKKTIDDLAIFGAPPAFSKSLHVGRPNIGNREKLMQRINYILDSRWLTNDGTFVQEFEQRIAEIVGVKHCIAMCNATIALEIAIRASGMTGEVIVPSMTFVATAHALQWQEITPVFCDIDPVTCNIDPKKIEQMITPRTTGIIGVHLWSRPCDVDALAELAQKHNLKLIYDAAHAFGCSYNGKMIGNFGDAEVFSFHATKFLNSAEGGAVVTNDDELAQKIRWMKNFGFEDVDLVVYIGTNGKMNEFSAAMGLTSLESLDEIIETNRQNYFHYRKELSGIPGVTLAQFNEGEKCNYQYIIVQIDKDVTGISRDEIKDILWSENILARRYFYPGCHRMEPYRSYFPHAGLLLPETERLADRVLALPTGTAVGAAEISEVANIIRLAIANSKQIGEKLGNRPAAS
ncbi:dTDP-4-dehydro-6-deoxyglucose aminotransferase [Ornatilinea apprima]|uniref:dTDP-4-dehydro-6-deoxyglucose aminotransferase n=1 Tax=Ornatilinea apprima TaxID=1134406 RepID=A0A0P6XLS7_9CHLR|nr:aminotransferase class I/II-fold pyridoxal phosphate-dependent enzyme [Ornatilinea apprima]KPL77254.1 dTDP-4-dehydro-6-deoxyglucose aminotransferase [Ornatilinea apprima]